MLPSSELLERVARSSTLTVGETAGRIHWFEQGTAPAAVQTATAVLVQGFAARIGSDDPEVIRLCALAIGGGYASGRAILDLRGDPPPELEHDPGQLLELARRWDYPALAGCVGRSVHVWRRAFVRYVVEAFPAVLSREAIRPEVLAMACAGLGMALAEAELASRAQAVHS